MIELKIGDRPIGPAHRTLVVAELGVNHDGSLTKALDLVRTAANCGADAIKLQVFVATRLMHPRSAFAEYQKEATGDATPTDMLRRYQLPASAVQQIVQRARDLKLIPLATPFSPTDLETLDRLSLPAIKIASPDLVNRPLLAAAARLGKPLLLSTGAATMAEVERTAGWLREWGVKFALLHCISSYPTPKSQAHLCWIGELAWRFDVPIGYSDHTTEPLAGAMAVAAGAVLVERHLTYDRGAARPDHAASSDPSQFERYVKMIREADMLARRAGQARLGRARRRSPRQPTEPRPAPRVAAGRPAGRGGSDRTTPGHRRPCRARPRRRRPPRRLRNPRRHDARMGHARRRSRQSGMNGHHAENAQHFTTRVENPPRGTAPAHLLCQRHAG